jgi:hypothetical protein
MSEASPTPGNILSNKIKIEKDNKSYNLDILNDGKEIILKCRIEKPLKVYERKCSKQALEEISKIFKGCDDINEAYTYILNSLENKQFIFNITNKSIVIKFNKMNIFEFKDIVLTEKEIDTSEKIENLYNIQEDLLNEIESLKKEINLLKNENQNLKNMCGKIDIIDVKLFNGSNFGSEFNPFQIFKINNFIKFSGLVNCTLGQSIFQLPENCRPKGRLIFSCCSRDKAIRVDVCADGNIYPLGSGNAWVSFDNISFLSGK